MATLTVQITSGAGTTTSSATFSSADAQRILTDFQQTVPNGTQQNLNDYLLSDLKLRISQFVQRAETPTGPTFT